MRILLVVLALMLGGNAMAQNNFDISKDKENGSTLYRGQLTFNDLHEQLSFKWLDQGVKEYKPDTASIRFLKQNLPVYHITVFLGTWCSDSQDLVPKFYKVLQETDYPMNQYLMYGVDREKHAKGGEEKMYNVTNVPVFILYKNNREIGRITEAVTKSIEADLCAVIEKDLHQKH